MMNYLKKWKVAALTAGICMVFGGTLYAADNKPVELTADTVEYNSQSGMVTATGNVVMIQEGARITGVRGEYNSKTQAGTVSGNVVADKEDMHMTADTVKSLDANHMLATGNVVAVKADKTLTGPIVDYYSDKNYVIVPSNAKVVMADGTMTSDKLEGYLTDNHLIGTGNVHILSPARNMEAFGNQADYYGQEQGKVILTGNAVAIQDNNTIKSNRLTLYLADDGQAKAKE